MASVSTMDLLYSTIRLLKFHWNFNWIVSQLFDEFSIYYQANPVIIFEILWVSFHFHSTRRWPSLNISKNNSLLLSDAFSETGVKGHVWHNLIQPKPKKKLSYD